MSKQVNFVLRAMWTFVVMINIHSWYMQWTKIGQAETFEEVQYSIIIWMPLAFLFAVYGTLRFMELHREAHREVEAPAS